MSSQALLWVPYCGSTCAKSCSYVVRAQQSEYLRYRYRGRLAAIMSMYLLREGPHVAGARPMFVGSIFFKATVRVRSLVTVAVYILGRINFIQDYAIQQLRQAPRKAGRLEVGHHGGGARGRGGSWTSRCACDTSREAMRHGPALRHQPRLHHGGCPGPRANRDLDLSAAPAQLEYADDALVGMAGASASRSAARRPG